MSTTEDRLRDALAATALAAGPVPELVMGLAAGLAPTAHRRRRRYAAVPRMAFPVAAATLVLIVVGVIVMVLRHDVRDPAMLAAPPSRPHFVVSITGGGSLEVFEQDSPTGTRRLSVPNPPGVVFHGLNPTEDHRVFFISGSDTRGGAEVGSMEGVVAYLLTIDRSGRTAALTEIRNLGGVGEDFTSASPDGTRLVRGRLPTGPDLDGSAQSSPYRIEIVTPGTSETKTFTLARNGPGTSYSYGGAGSSFSWDATGRYLAFFLSGTRADDGIRILDTEADGGDLIANSRLITGTARLSTPTAQTRTGTPVLSADARHVYVIASEQAADGSGVSRVVELDARDGRQTRVLLEQRNTDPAHSLGQMAVDLVDGDLRLRDSHDWRYSIDVSTGAVAKLPPWHGELLSMAW
ncbi:hypothetical protein MXD62_34345 [Frankia sp. Mgl5]|uniref:hypothetical protein n=1 Tax=Frankia sp. Mgl5 TaxID=2933793 RepID=UPI00200FAA4A|nr:hypothetical protein [Frankia sp. Mgl5]MCK9932162.1 hypothetical protein [Frankia sp. Mgl5]